MAMPKTDAPIKAVKPTRGRGKQKYPFDQEAAIAYLSKKDRKLMNLIKSTGSFTMDLQDMHSCFDTLMESIVYQQLTGKAAATILKRVKALYADCFPLPERLLDTADDTLRQAGLSRAKVAALKDLAEKTVAGAIPEIHELSKLSDEKIVEILSSVRGIGEWTVQMLLIFRLGRPDVLPINDYGIRKSFALVYGLEDLPKPKELLAHGERWRPYRSVASWYLWRATDKPQNKARK